MSIDLGKLPCRGHAADDAIVGGDQAYSYGWLAQQVHSLRGELAADGIGRGAVCLLEGDFSPVSVALFLTLLEAGCILVPLSGAAAERREEFSEIAQAEYRLRVDGEDHLRSERLGRQADHPLYEELRKRRHPGLVLFSSGSTGRSKAAVHDLTGLLEKFQMPRKAQRAISFLLYDHIGGVNTMLYTLSNGGCLVTVPQRDPDTVLGAIAKHRVQLLPTSPTFINLILLSEAYRRHDLSSLETVTYGTEPMPASTLERFHQLFPKILLQQTYGLSELGILRSKSLSSDSLWVKLGGEGYETRVVDGLLEIKARSAMLGYLNASSPFTEDGWFKTGDAVLQDGEYLRILGRKSELINVGGQKVYPAEVESVIQRLENVRDVTVHGEANALTGQIVCARVTLQAPEDARAFTIRLKKFCRAHLASFQVPARVTLVSNDQYGARFKRLRGSSEASEISAARSERPDASTNGWTDVSA